MTPQRPLDDATAEALLRGAPVAPGFEPLAEVVAVLRGAALGAVRPEVELTRRLAEGDFSGVPAAVYEAAGNNVRGRRKVGTVVRTGMSKLAAMSVRAKVAAGLAVGFTAFSGVTAAGALPDAAQERVESVIEAVTPVTFPERAEFGQDVAEDARDGGVDGDEISDQAQERAGKPDDPGEDGPGDEGQGDEGRSDEHRRDDPGGQPTDLPSPRATPPVDPDGPPDDRPGEHPTTGRQDDQSGDDSGDGTDGELHDDDEPPAMP